MLASIRTSRSCTSWKPAIGRPNCCAFLGVGERVLVGAAGAADRLPGHPGPGQPQHRRGVAERVRPLQPVRLRNPDPVQGDVGVLHHPQRDLVVHLGGLEARRALLHHEPLDLAVLHVAGPDDGVVGERGVADPLLLPVQHPVVAVAPGRGGQPARGARIRRRARSARTRRSSPSGPSAAASAASAPPTRTGRSSPWPGRCARRRTWRSRSPPGPAPSRSCRPAGSRRPGSRSP